MEYLIQKNWNTNMKATPEHDKRIAEMKPIKYKSRDGLTIHGYLTLPKGSNTITTLILVLFVTILKL